MQRALVFVCLVMGTLVGLGVTAAARPASAEQHPLWGGAKSDLKQGEMLKGGTSTPTPAGCMTSYTCSTTAGATIVAGTTDTGNHCDECTTMLTLPFSVQLYEQTYGNIIVSDNGYAQFVDIEPEFENVCLPAAALGPTIFAYWDDLLTKGTKCTGGCGIYTSVSGSAPNRIFNIEWRTFYFSNPGNAYFEIRLFEGMSSFEVILGQVNTGATSTTGVQDGSGRFTQCRCNTAPTVNSRIVFTTNGCPTPTNTPVGPTNTPGGNTATVTVTPTATPTRTGTTVPPTGSPTPMATSTGTAVASATGVASASPTGTATPCSVSFSDVGPDDFFYEGVQYLACRGVISGYADGTFRPFNNTTRSQMVKIVVLGFEIPLSTNDSPLFEDVPNANPFFVFVQTAAENEIVSGYFCGSEGEPCVPPLNLPYFRPFNLVTRGQLAKIVVAAAQWELINPSTPTFVDVPPSDPFYRVIETAFCHEIISGYADQTFRPGNPATRGQIAKIVHLAVIDDGTNCS